MRLFVPLCASSAVCHSCSERPSDFLCLDCQTYQCEECCAKQHVHTVGFSAHLYFCVDGASSSLLRYARWSPEFLEMAKMSRRMKLQALEDARVAAATTTAAAITAASAIAIKEEAAAVAAAARAVPAPLLQPEPATIASGSPHIKAERAVRPPSGAASPEPIRDMQALSIAEPPTVVQHAEPLSVPQAPQALAPVKPEPSPVLSTAPTLSGPAQVAPPAISTPGTVASTLLLAQPQPAAPTTDAAAVKHELQPSAVPLPSIAPTSSAGANDVVDLTEDDDELSSVKPEPFSRTGSVFAPREPLMKRENSSWLAAASTPGAAAAASSMLRDDDDSSAFSLTDEDPIKRTMISEYNRLSEVIFNHEQEIAAIQAQIKDMLADTGADMNKVVQCSTAVAQVKNSVVKETHNRNAVVARLVVYIKSDPSELQALMDASASADIPHMQTASHRRCAQLEALIREKRFGIRKLKRSMEEAIAMKSASDPFAEVSRLGAMIAAAEQEVRESEDARLVELVRLFQFSSQIRTAARAMMR